MARDDGERLQELAHNVLAPVVLGGPIRLVRPFGAKLALRLGESAIIADSDLRSRMDVARVRRARLVAPIDTLPELDAAEWAMAAALNDLLQLTNHELGGALRRGRYTVLLANVRELCDGIRPPRDVGEALARHATFARVLELARTDRLVSWWTGSARFRGEQPPARLLSWPNVRRVRVDETRVPLVEMCGGAHPIAAADFVDAVARLLTRTPLTDIATLARPAPAFRWSPPTLGLVATAPGRTLAWRALLRQPEGAAAAVLARATAEIPSEAGDAKAIANAFAAAVGSNAKRSA